ncbi:hypothetical protein [Microbacterium pumilum]|uniref:Uncharacterized protein n=1 Tax=Microbacterium pumilum TaxID=344165 RepID=A0ABP5EBT3_9MICO
MSSNDRQHIERVAGSRRARLTPAPGTAPEPVPSEETEDAAPVEGDAASGSGPNDERMRRDVPPHY